MNRYKILSFALAVGLSVAVGRFVEALFWAILPVAGADVVEIMLAIDRLQPFLDRVGHRARLGVRIGFTPVLQLLRDLRDEGRVMLVATHNLGSVPEFCDRVVLVKGTVLAHGPVDEVFTPDNLKETFGGVLRHFLLEGQRLHDDEDPRKLNIYTDDERPLVIYDDRHRMVKGKS